MFVFAFTALAWAFEWFNKEIFTLTNSSVERAKAPKNIEKNTDYKLSVEAALQTVFAVTNTAV